MRIRLRLALAFGRQGDVLADAIQRPLWPDHSRTNPDTAADAARLVITRTALSCEELWSSNKVASRQQAERGAGALLWYV
jgi:hypothetical protein